MRFLLALHADKNAFGNRLPLNYQYELSAFIYRAIARADGAYAQWLHENGFQLDGRPFKLFTFSNLDIPQRKISSDRLYIESEQVKWQVSFLPEASTEKFVQGVFSEQVFQVGDKKSVVQFRVEQIEVLPTPTFEPEMHFRTLSPACIPYRVEGQRHPEYISPERPEAADIVLNNLLSKYHTFYGKPYEGSCDFALHPTNQPKAKLIKIKSGTPEETFIKGHMFEFRMRASEELMGIAHEAGVGEKGSMGFGMVGVLQ
jgi:CRISPR-associated endoribonuclease Cas6